MRVAQRRGGVAARRRRLTEAKAHRARNSFVFKSNQRMAGTGSRECGAALDGEMAAKPSDEAVFMPPRRETRNP